jgi:hypothetical protein
VHDGGGLRRPVGAADLARVRDDDHGLFSALSNSNSPLANPWA